MSTLTRTYCGAVTLCALTRNRLQRFQSAASETAHVLKACLLPSLALSVIYSLPSYASEWQYSADIFTGLTYTDNGLLTPSEKEDEVIWELSPSIVATRDGKRVDVQFDYRLQALLYADEDGRNEVYNYLQSRLQAAVIPNFLQFDADASISQTVIDPLLASGNSAISVSGNSAETMTLNASPYIVRRFGPSTELKLGASAGLVEYDEPTLVDSKQTEYFASLVNEGRGGPFNWMAGYNSTLVEYDVGQEIELARITGEIGLRLGPRTEFVVSGGEDINDFGSLSGTRVAEGTFWNVGFRGGVGNNIQFDVRVGEQFFGDSYSVQFTWSSRAIETTLSYTEEATTVGAQQLDYRNALGLLSLAGEFNDQSDISGFDLPQSDPELYIRRRVDWNNSLTTGKSTWNGRIYYEDRSFIRTSLDGTRENVQGARFSWTWDYDRATTVTTSGVYQRLDSRDGVSLPQDYSVNVRVRREILNNSYIQVTTSYNTRSAPRAMDEYEEIALGVGFGRKF